MPHRTRASVCPPDLFARTSVALRRVWTIMAVAVTLGACSQGPIPGPSRETTDSIITAEVTAFLTGYAAKMNGGDTAAIRTLYTPDERFTWMEDGRVRYESVDAVIEALSAFPPGSGFTTTFGAPVIVPLGTRAASARTTFRTELGPEQGNFAFGGIITMAVERQSDGGWRIVTGHTSTERERGG